MCLPKGVANHSKKEPATEMPRKEVQSEPGSELYTGLRFQATPDKADGQIQAAGDRVITVEPNPALLTDSPGKAQLPLGRCSDRSVPWLLANSDPCHGPNLWPLLESASVFFQAGPPDLLFVTRQVKH